MLAILKLNSRCALVRFWNHAYDFRPNCTPLSSITIIYRFLSIGIRNRYQSSIVIDYWFIDWLCLDWIGPFHLIAAPPLLKGFLRIYPLRKRRSKCRPSYPLGKTTILFKDQRSRLAYPLGNYPYLSLPSPKNSCTFNRGGAAIKWNGPFEVAPTSCINDHESFNIITIKIRG